MWRKLVALNILLDNYDKRFKYVRPELQKILKIYHLSHFPHASNDYRLIISTIIKVEDSTIIETVTSVALKAYNIALKLYRSMKNTSTQTTSILHDLYFFKMQRWYTGTQSQISLKYKWMLIRSNIRFSFFRY